MRNGKIKIFFKRVELQAKLLNRGKTLPVIGELFNMKVQFRACRFQVLPGRTCIIYLRPGSDYSFNIRLLLSEPVRISIKQQIRKTGFSFLFDLLDLWT